VGDKHRRPSYYLLEQSGVHWPVGNENISLLSTVLWVSCCQGIQIHS